MHIGNWRITTHSEFVPNNIHDQIAQRQRCEMEKKEQEQQRKAMEEQRKWAEAMLKPVEKAQHQESVDLNSYEEQKALRTKALELACNLARTPRYDGDIPIVDVAKLFYTYITKGE